MKRKRTFSARPRDITRGWYLMDANDKILGRLAGVAAKILWGKNKIIFTPHMDTGDHVIVINAQKIKVTGGKEKKKMYFTHSLYPGGAKLLTFEDMMKRDPRKVIRHAVKGMLPRGRLGNSMLKKLHLFAGDKHTFTGKDIKTI